MGRVKIKFPEQKPLYTASIPVRITDINYGNHLGNDALLSLIHESRMQLLSQWGYDELNAGGSALIMADVMIAYRGEAFYGDILDVKLYAEELTNQSFDLLYRITTERKEKTIEIAHAKTGMICFDYGTRKIAPMGEGLRTKLTGI
ncbi:MAG: thioesterase family protein [Bacteroidetes bacterium]|nr:thioesterase family protein [Bacteroidota bacterium]